ncbi:MAG: MerR family transcriptional regulator [Clostridiales bacterium]|nr:MerR family transcriptional regulator [Clostridiales bacterium]
MRYKIGDLARLFNLSTESIRHYERQGLIHPQKAEGSSYRYYQAWDMAVLSACRQYRALGFTLEESAEMLGQRNPTAVLDELRGREEAIAGAGRRRRPAL